MDNQQTSLTHFSIYKIDAHAVTLLCSVIVARPHNFACPFRHTHAPHHRPTLLAFNPPTVRNQFTTRQAGTSTVFCFAIKFDWCKRGSQSLAHSHTYKCINTDMRLLHASVSLALTYVNNKTFSKRRFLFMCLCVCV